MLHSTIFLIMFMLERICFKFSNFFDSLLFNEARNANTCGY